MKCEQPAGESLRVVLRLVGSLRNTAGWARVECIRFFPSARAGESFWCVDLLLSAVCSRLLSSQGNRLRHRKVKGQKCRQ